MKLPGQLRTLFSFANNSPAKKDFNYPYSDNVQQKREEIWQNLQKGVLLEDKGLLVPWLSPFADLTSIAEQRRERADRTELALGKRIILSGYEADLELLRWKYKDGDELIKQVTENLGQNEEGERRFNYLGAYLTDLLGEPTYAGLQKFESWDIGSITWQNGAIALTLTGLEHGTLRYSFSIGIKMPNAY